MGHVVKRVSFINTLIVEEKFIHKLILECVE